MKRAALLFLSSPCSTSAPGFLPGRTFAPLDIPLDTGAWKADPTQRVRVSNTLLSDVVTQFIPWDREILRLAAAARCRGSIAGPATAGRCSRIRRPRSSRRSPGRGCCSDSTAGRSWRCSRSSPPRSARTGSRASSTCCPAQAIVSALVYATAGYTIVWLLYPITNVFVLLPGLAAAALRLMKRRRCHNAALVILFAALCTAGGHPETLFIGVARHLDLSRVGSGEAPRPRHLRARPVDRRRAPRISAAVRAARALSRARRRQLRERVASALPHPFRPWAVVSQVLPGILGSPLRGELDLTRCRSAENFNQRAAASSARSCCSR